MLLAQCHVPGDVQLKLFNMLNDAIKEAVLRERDYYNQILTALDDSIEVCESVTKQWREENPELCSGGNGSASSDAPESTPSAADEPQDSSESGEES